jgi:dihydrofolate synthase / folylpolyglutamate synthase
LNDREALQAWLQRQQHSHPHSIELGLGRVRAVADALGLLPVRVPSIIVGGTNGKGSTATHLAALLHASGWRTGLFTSPHLRRYNERVAINGDEAGDSELVAAFEAIDAARGAITLTYFEYNTLAALQVFRERQVEAMVLEVGLGGRLDSTNIVDADLAVLCSVAIDHTDWLGPTRAGIGAEKAGIFRAGRPVVLGDSDMPGSVYERARALRCETLVAGNEFRFAPAADDRWQYCDGLGALADLPAPVLAGAVQYRNAATALAAGRRLQAKLGLSSLQQPQVVYRGLAAVHLSGRFQIVPGDVEWIIDVAHNPAAAAELAAALRARPAATHTRAVFGMLADKDVTAVTAIIGSLVDEWLLCDTHGERGLAAGALRERMGTVRGVVRSFTDVAAACSAARATAVPGDRVLVFGSFHVAGPALDALGL